MINSILFILIYLSVVFPGISMADTIMTETFESGDLFTTNADGFTWGGMNRTSIVTMEPDCGGLTSGNATVIFNGSSICNGPISGRDWTAKTGKNSLRFRYVAGQPMAEQRFDLGVGYSELWVSYWIRVPVNFTRGSGTNNKWFKFWMGDYALYDDSRVSQFQLQDNPGSPSTNIDIKLGYDNSADGTTHYGPNNADFVTPADAGRWMQVVYYMRASTGGGAADGEIAAYRKWEDESSYTSLGDLDNIEIPISAASISSGYNGWGTGYLMGWANAPYAEDTEWLVDDFTLSTTSLLPTTAKAPTIINIK